MHLHEYQAKEFLGGFAVPYPTHEIVRSEKEIHTLLEHWKDFPAVVKVQVHAGGRGKAGGVKLCQSKEELEETLNELLGKKIVTPQTGRNGVIAHQLLVSKAVDIAKEFYLACVIDRKEGVMKMIASSEGGMEIEEIAKSSPEKIVQIPIQQDGSILGFHFIEIAKALGLSFEKNGEAWKFFSGVAKAFATSDASLIEINPLVKTKDNRLLALDAKMTIDDNALFRQTLLAKLYDPTQELSSEVEAHKQGLSYIALEGTIGCMVNGAGLAMATMDIIQLHGLSPANFLDVGGSADVEKVTEGFYIILSDPKVEAILVNIFGGIMNCKTIAEGVIQAFKKVQLTKPLIVRLEGTNVEEARRMLVDSHLPIISAISLSDAAEKVVASVR